jgi:hypothetical protein
MRKTSFELLNALALAAALLASGCGSESEGDEIETLGMPASAAGAGGSAAVAATGCTMSAGGTEVTGFCANAPLNALTAAEAVQLCTDTGAYVARSVSRAAGCKYVGIVNAASNSSPTEAELQAACSARETSCNQDTSVPLPGAGTLCGQIPATCVATIEQYSTCVKDEAVIFDQEAAGLVSCSMLTFGNLSTVYDVPNAASAAPSCMELKRACPNLSLPYIN